MAKESELTPPYEAEEPTNLTTPCPIFFLFFSVVPFFALAVEMYVRA